MRTNAAKPKRNAVGVQLGRLFQGQRGGGEGGEGHPVDGKGSEIADAAPSVPRLRVHTGAPSARATGESKSSPYFGTQAVRGRHDEVTSSAKVTSPLPSPPPPPPPLLLKHCHPSSHDGKEGTSGADWRGRVATRRRRTRRVRTSRGRSSTSSASNCPNAGTHPSSVYLPRASPWIYSHRVRRPSAPFTPVDVRKRERSIRSARMFCASLHRERHQTKKPVKPPRARKD